MDIDQLKQLDTIATLGTISAAADELHIPQPTLSRSIRRLEQELGHDLLLRRGRHIEINDAGRLALEYIRPMLRDERLMREALNQLTTTEHVLRIGTVAPTPLWHLSSLIIERFPDITFSSTTIPQHDITQSLTNNTIALAISHGDVVNPEFRSCSLVEENLYVVLSNDHSLAQQKTVTFRQLDGETFLLCAAVGFWRDVCDTYVPNSHFIVQEDHEIFAQLATNTRTAYFTTDAPSQWQLTVGENHTAIPIADEAAHASFYLVMRADADGHPREVFEWIAEHNASTSSLTQ